VNAATTRVVGTEPTCLTADVLPPLDHYRQVVISSAGSASAYLGGPTVTASDYGYELKPGHVRSLVLSHDDEVFAVVAADTLTLDVCDDGPVTADGSRLLNLA
jgi:hypothetical protein